MQALVVTALLCASLGINIAASDKTKICFKGNEAEPTGNVTLTCAQGEVIIVEEALFGRNKWGACVISDGDCVERTRIFNECDNLNNCSRSFKTYLTSCGYATVIFISYSCLQASPVSVYTTAASATTPTTRRANNSAVPRIALTRKPTELVNGSEGDSLNETGLIAGCVVAAVVTVIALVIAITMVIRRLMNKNNSDDDDDGDDDSTDSKNFTRCIGCSFAPKQTAHQQKLKAQEKTSSSSALSKQDRKQTPIKPELMSTDKNKSATRASKETSTVPENITQQQDTTTTNSQQHPEDFHKLDSNANSRMISSNPAEHLYYKDRMVNSVKVANVLNKEIISGYSASKSSPRMEDTLKKELVSSQDGKGDHCHIQQQTSQRNEIDRKESSNRNGPKFDAVSIPNTVRGTAC